MSKLELSAFKLERVNFELRFDPAFLLWDKAGLLAASYVERWPALELTQADPGSIAFSGEEISVRAELKRAIFTRERLEGSISNLAEPLSDFVEITLRVLGIDLVERMGFRPQYFLRTSSREEACSLVLGTGLLITSLQRPVFGSDAKIDNSEIVVGFKSKGMGTTFRLGAQTREFNVKVPAEIPEMSSEHRKFNGVYLDVDFYTPAPIRKSQVGIKNWVEQIVHMINRDVSTMLGA